MGNQRAMCERRQFQFRHDLNKRGKSSPSNPSPNSFIRQSERKPSRTRSPRGRSPSGRMSRWPCKDYLRGTCNNSFCEKWHPPECLYYKTKSGCRFGEKCAFAHRQVDEQPTKRSKTNNDKSAVAMLKKGIWQESVTDGCHDRTGQSVKRSDKKLGQNSSKRRFTDARQLGDIVKDNSGSYAVFTEQGSSASQMTAAKIMDIISRLPGCDWQAADAVSVYTQVIMEDAHKLLKIPKSECPDIWIRLPRHKWPKSWSSMEDPVVPLERKLYGHLLAGLLWERQFEKILLKHGWEKVPNWECLFVHR